jgi:glutamyl-tRNA synthetase
MISAFSLERVVKSPASFDPTKLTAFQQRAMDQLDLKQKTAMSVPYLQQAGLIDTPPICDTAPYVNSIITASEQRMTVAGDILNYDDFFTDDDAIEYDEKSFGKRIANSYGAVEILRDFANTLAAIESYNAESVEAAIRQFIADGELKFGQVVHPLRVAITGKPAGFGLFDTLAILGQQRCLNRIERAITLAISSHDIDTA